MSSQCAAFKLGTSVTTSFPRATTSDVIRLSLRYANKFVFIRYDSDFIKMDQSPKAKQLILKYDQETRNNKWFRKIFDRLQRLSCCVSGETENSQDNHYGEGDVPLEELPCLVEIPIFMLDNNHTEIKPLNCEGKVEQQKLNPLSLKDLASEAYHNSKSSGLRRKRRRHSFYQAAYTGGFQSFVGGQ